MTAQQPPPEAVEVLAEVIHAVENGRYNESASPDHNRWTWGGDGLHDGECEQFRKYATAALTYLADAIHGDGPESDAVREALRLGVQEAEDGWFPGRRIRRIVGAWRTR